MEGKSASPLHAMGCVCVCGRGVHCRGASGCRCQLGMLTHAASGATIPHLAVSPACPSPPALQARVTPAEACAFPGKRPRKDPRRGGRGAGGGAAKKGGTSGAQTALSRSNCHHSQSFHPDPRFPKKQRWIRGKIGFLKNVGGLTQASETLRRLCLDSEVWF